MHRDARMFEFVSTMAYENRGGDLNRYMKTEDGREGRKRHGRPVRIRCNVLWRAEFL